MCRVGKPSSSKRSVTDRLEAIRHVRTSEVGYESDTNGNAAASSPNVGHDQHDADDENQNAQGTNLNHFIFEGCDCGGPC